LVVGMRLAREHELDAAIAEQRLDALGIAEDQVAPLVRRGPAREADRQDVGIEADTRAERDLVQELALEHLVRRPEGLGRRGVAYAHVLPGGGVDAVRD